MDAWAELVGGLTVYDAEGVWFEFKESRFKQTARREYVSAFSNAAAMVGRKSAYLVWGVRDSDHEVVETGFLWQRDVGSEPLGHWIARQVQPDGGFRFHEATARDQRVVVLVVPAARVVPTPFAGERLIRIGSSKERLSKYPERESQLFEVSIADTRYVRRR